ncbi:MAG: hypothetical protein AB4290_02950 [Spirulina sp.]
MVTEQLHSTSTRVHEGDNIVQVVLEDIARTFGTGGGTVHFSGIDTHKFLSVNPEQILTQLQQLVEQGIEHQILTHPENMPRLQASQVTCRWMPEHFFSPTPICVYGHKVATIAWGSPHRAVVIEDFSVADAYRKQFLWMWSQAEQPSVQSNTLEGKTRLAEGIIKRYGGRISYITSKDRSLFRTFREKDGNPGYGNSFYYLCQAVNGLGPDGLGLKYFDGKMLVTIGLGDRFSLGGNWHYHVVNPMGEFDPERLFALCKHLLELSGVPVFVKKLEREERDRLLEIGFSPIEDYPWHAQAMEEDDTFPEQIVDVDGVLKRLERYEATSSLKRNYRRYCSKFEEQTTWEPLGKDYHPDNSVEAEAIVREFFDYLDIKQLHISRPSDYDNIIHYPPIGNNGKSYFAQLVRVAGEAAGFFAMEPVSQDMAGLYASIALHQKFPYLSEYLVVECCKVLKQAGYRYLNLGGSETSGLFGFKEKFFPVDQNRMYWVVYKV